MKRTSLLLAALLPAAALAAAEQLNHEALRGDTQVTRLLGAEVRSSDGQEVGSVEDVILDMEGKVVSVIVQRDSDAKESLPEEDSAARDTLASAEDTATGRERPTREDIAADVGRTAQRPVQHSADNEATDNGFVKADWASVSFDPDGEILQLRSSAAELQPASYEQDGDAPFQGEVRASALVGMEVNLTDEESFGEIEDVLIDLGSGTASALVVDSMQFFDKERYALPVNLDNVNPEEEELTLEVTQQELEAMGEFDMEGAGESM